MMIRKANPADKQAIWCVRTRGIRESCKSHYAPEEIDAWSSSSMPENFEDVITSKDFLVADEQNLMVGFGFLDRATARIEAVFVSPDFQRKGIGRQLLDALEMIAREAGLQALSLSSTLNAVEFYKSAGYRVREHAKYIHPSGFTLDCVLMEKALNTES
jgi:putative acetyltransferase